MNTNDTHTNDADAANDANANADESANANANDADAAYKADGNINAKKDDKLLEEVDPFPVLSCEERSWYIEKQRVLIRSLIREFGLEREVHYTTFNPPFGFVYEGALADILELDLVIYEIIYERKKREVYYFYVLSFPGGTMIPVRADRYNMAEGPSSNDNEDKDDNDNNIVATMAVVARIVSLQTSIGKLGINARLILMPHFLFPLPNWLARQANNLRAHLSVFPNGH
jgi:hypothetical protein